MKNTAERTVKPTEEDIHVTFIQSVQDGEYTPKMDLKSLRSLRQPPFFRSRYNDNTIICHYA